MKGLKNEKEHHQTTESRKISDILIILNKNYFIFYGHQRNLLNTSQCSFEEGIFPTKCRRCTGDSDTFLPPLLPPLEDSFQPFREKLKTIPSIFPQCHLISIYPYTCHKMVFSRNNSQVQTCLLKPALTIYDCCINRISKARIAKILEHTVLPVLPLPCTAHSM